MHSHPHPPLSQLRLLGAPYCLDFWGIFWGFLALTLFDSAVSAAASGQRYTYDDEGPHHEAPAKFSTAQVFVFVVAFQLRRLARDRLAIPGTCVEDFLCAWFCA